MAERFDWVLGARRTGPDGLFDIDLGDDPSTAIVPTRGSLFPGWVLLIPRIKFLSISSMPPFRRTDLMALARNTTEKMQAFGSRAFYFEHGPKVKRSAMGCGVDQAHLHSIVTDHDLSAHVLKDHAISWKACNPSDPWADILSGVEYYLIHDQVSCFVAYPERAESQYFRRRIAEVLGRASAWDYREFPFHENARETTERFRVQTQSAA